MKKIIAVFSFALAIGSGLVQAEVNQEKIKQWKSVTLSTGVKIEWESITRISESGFTYMTAIGIGTVKFEDLTPEQQKEIGYTRAATPQAAGPVASADPAVYYDQAIKACTLRQVTMRSEIAQLQADVARSKALNPNSSTETWENSIKWKEAKIKITDQEGRVLQEQKAAALIGRNNPTNEHPAVSTALGRVNTVKLTLAQKKIKKQQLILESMQADLAQPGGANSYQSQIAYNDRDIAALEAEVRAAEANVNAVRVAQQLK